MIGMLIVVGTNHKYSPIEFRERIFFSKYRIPDALLLLKESKDLEGAVILATCNRVEIYAYVQDKERGIKELLDFMSFYHEIEKSRLLPYLYIYAGKEALRHLFLVAAGLDAQVLGETQVLSQVKFAFEEAQRLGGIDRYLERVFTSAFSVAKKIHSQTGISKGHISVGSVAVSFLKEKLGKINQKNILIIGMGKITDLVLKYLRQENPNLIFVANRTFVKAKELAKKINGKAIKFDELNKFLKEADAVITATASPHFVIKKEMLQGLIKHRLLIIDLAIPRDVQPQVREIENVDLFDLEGLNSIIQETIEKRRAEAGKATLIIDREIDRLWEKFIELEPEAVLLPLGR